MAKVLQHRRGTSSEHANFTGAAGEITFDTTNKRLVAHDGSTKGGISMAKVSELESAKTELQGKINQVSSSLDPRILDAASQADILEAVGQVGGGSVSQPPEATVITHTVGEEWHSFTGLIPVGGVPYCGQLVTREVYWDLWQYAQTQGLVKTESEWQSIASAQNGNVPYYSTGDGSTTFRMPQVVGYLKGASSQSEAGEYVAEGLPNITGHGYDHTTTDYTSASSGAFYSKNIADKVTVAAWSGSTSRSARSMAIDASRSSPIYGNSDHVTPETNTVLFGVYAFSNVANVGELDASALATALARVEANVVDKSLPHIVEAWSSGTSWYRKYSDGWIEQGDVYVHTAAQNATLYEIATTLHTPFATTKYNVQLQGVGFGTSSASQALYAKNKSQSSFTLCWQNKGSTEIDWYACGY